MEVFGVEMDMVAGQGVQIGVPSLLLRRPLVGVSLSVCCSGVWVQVAVALGWLTDSPSCPLSLAKGFAVVVVVVIGVRQVWPLAGRGGQLYRALEDVVYVDLPVKSMFVSVSVRVCVCFQPRGPCGACSEGVQPGPRVI